MVVGSKGFEPCPTLQFSGSHFELWLEEEIRERKDDCGAWIKRDFYGKESEFSWEIDHVKPKSKDDSDEIANSRSLQSQNNVRLRPITHIMPESTPPKFPSD
jgi:hypothetical protein